MSSINRFTLTVITSTVLCDCVYSAAPLQTKPALIYNIPPRLYDSDFQAMQHDLERISGLGFNAVWLYPFMATSHGDLNFTPIMMLHGSTSWVPGQFERSAYAMHDPSRIDCQSSEGSDGNPSKYGLEMQQIKEFTAEACRLDIAPIFDLVLHHVSRKSPLVTGTFSYFIENSIDTNKWFREYGDPGMPDIAIFDYSNPEIALEIVNWLWAPFIRKMMNCYGFTGVRIDMATQGDVPGDITQMCLNIVRQCHRDPVIFAEDLLGDGRPHDQAIDPYRGVGYTHVTSNVYALPEWAIGNKNEYEWLRHLNGEKKEMTNSGASAYRRGVIGFAGSHDAGTTALNCKTRANVMINPNISDSNPLLQMVKIRLAMAAFTSDAGWYLLAGDECLSDTNKSPVIDPTVADLERYLLQTEIQALMAGHDVGVSSFIRGINDVFVSLREAPEIFWFELFSDNPDGRGHPSNFLYFVRHIDGQQNGMADIVVVKVSENDVAADNEETIIHKLKGFGAELLGNPSNYNVKYVNARALT